MKLWKSACAVAFAAGISCAANAATYNVSGVMTGVDIGLPPGSSEYDMYEVAFNPANPAFTGLWNIDLSSFAFSGVADFESYQVHTEAFIVYMGSDGSMSIGGGIKDETRPHDVHTIDGSGATYSFDPATRTLDISQPVVTLSGISQDCTTTGLYCFEGDFEPFTEKEILFRLVFDEDFQAFTGTSTITRRFYDGSSDNTHWSFSGTAVPVPAAAWLFGSGVLGLAGLTRRRK